MSRWLVWLPMAGAAASPFAPEPPSGRLRDHAGRDRLAGQTAPCGSNSADTA